MPSSEFDLIAAITERLPPPGPRVKLASGDDAAVVEPRAASAITVDAVVDGVHFRLEEFGARAAGRKALAAALSDLAAMGAAQGEAYAVVGAPPELGDDELLGIADGLAEVAERESVSIAGGDLVRSPVLIISITAVGYEPGRNRLVTRAGARPRDVLAVTGELGGAAAALELLVGNEPQGLSPDQRTSLLARQLDPVPRLKEGRAIAAAGATAMIDVSDGLGAGAGDRGRRGRARGGPRAGGERRRGLRAAGRAAARQAGRGHARRGGGGIEADPDRLRDRGPRRGPPASRRRGARAERLRPEARVPLRLRLRRLRPLGLPGTVLRGGLLRFLGVKRAGVEGPAYCDLAVEVQVRIRPLRPARGCDQRDRAAGEQTAHQHP